MLMYEPLHVHLQVHTHAVHVRSAYVHGHVCPACVLGHVHSFHKKRMAVLSRVGRFVRIALRAQRSSTPLKARRPNANTAMLTVAITMIFGYVCGSLQSTDTSAINAVLPSENV